MGLEPMTYGLKVRCSTGLSYNPKVQNIVSSLRIYEKSIR
jgi:hypothetical protein